MLPLLQGMCLVFATLLALTSALPPHDPSAHPTLLARTGGPKELACFYRFEICHKRGVELTRRRQELDSRSRHLNHQLDTYTTMVTKQECGKNKDMYQTMLEEKYGRKREEKEHAAPSSTTADSEQATSTDPTTKDTSTRESAVPGNSTDQFDNQPYNSTTTEYCQKEKTCLVTARKFERENVRLDEFNQQKERLLAGLMDDLAFCGAGLYPERDAEPEESVQLAKRGLSDHPDKPSAHVRIASWLSSCETQLAAMRYAEDRLRVIKTRAQKFVSADSVAPRAETKDTPSAADGFKARIAINDTQIFDMERRSDKNDIDPSFDQEFAGWERCQKEVTTLQNTIRGYFATVQDLQDEYMMELKPTHIKKHKRQSTFVSHEESIPQVPSDPTVVRRGNKDVAKFEKYMSGKLDIVATFWKEKYSELYKMMEDHIEDIIRVNWDLAEYTRNKYQEHIKDKAEASRSMAAAHAATTSMASTATCADAGAMVSALGVQISQASVISSLEAKLSQLAATPASSVAIQTLAAKLEIPSTSSATVSPALQGSAATNSRTVPKATAAAAAATPSSEARSTAVSSPATEKAPIQEVPIDQASVISSLEAKLSQLRATPASSVAIQTLAPAPADEAAAIEKSISAVPATPKPKA